MTATQDRPAPEIGKDRRRKEDQRLITGRTRWTDNIQLNGMLHLAMVRSPFAHAKITNIDLEAAKAAPADLILVETDAPFLTPKPYRGRPNAPYLVPHTLRSLAQTKGMDEDTLAAAVAENARRAFAFPT